jgi:hypothetical protein
MHASQKLSEIHLVKVSEKKVPNKALRKKRVFSSFLIAYTPKQKEYHQPLWCLDTTGVV